MYKFSVMFRQCLFCFLKLLVDSLFNDLGISSSASERKEALFLWFRFIPLEGTSALESRFSLFPNNEFGNLAIAKIN